MFPGGMSALQGLPQTGFGKALEGVFPAFAVSILISVGNDHRVISAGQRSQWGDV